MRTLAAPNLMSHPEIESVISDLKAWSEAKYGRRSEIARILGVSPQLVSDWIARRADPRLEEWLNLKAFLKKQRRTLRRQEKERGESELRT